MIEVKYLGRNGNKMFQYCFGRILSNALKIPFQSPPINWFEDLKLSNFDEFESSKTFDKTVTLKRHIVDLEDIYRQAKEQKLKIILEGYFQRSEYFAPHKQDIKKWFNIDEDLRTNLLKKYDIKKNDVILHSRLGDYVTLGYIINPFHIKEIINNVLADDGKLFVVTDEINSNYHQFFKEYNPIILSNSDKEDFYLMTCFENIIMSQSSFSWWAAFFASESSKVYYPKTYNTGQWGIENKKEIDLISDENFIGVEYK